MAVSMLDDQERIAVKLLLKSLGAEETSNKFDE